MPIYKKPLDLWEFEHEFVNYNRDYYTPEGYEALFDYLEELSNETGEPFELDVISIVCEFTEYNSFEEFKKDYDKIENLEELQERTFVLELPSGGFVIQNF
jgi:hypothetical protein